MGMNLDELVKKWHSNSEINDEEYNFLEVELTKKMVNGETMSGEEFNIITEILPYECGDSNLSCDETWQEIIIEHEGKFYLTEVETVPTWGWNFDDTFQFVEVEKKLVLVVTEKWVPVEKEEE